MKILYGVQGTGNGHTSRARQMAKYFAQRADAELDYLFTGRPAEQYFDMDCFGDYQTRTGLSFTVKQGQISYLHTVLDASPLRFIQDVRQLDLSAYDLVITDFEPVSAWAGRLQKKTVIGIGHQYCFGYPEVPSKGENPITRLIMRNFAPVNIGIGLHWAQFGGPIVPPIAPQELTPGEHRGDHIVVYLPFEDQAKVSEVLQQFPEQCFLQYSPDLLDKDLGHLQQRKTNLHGFKSDLKNAKAVICNAGFELISECLQLGLPVLTRPVAGQSEQLSNGLALEQLNMATVMDSLSEQAIQQWLEQLPEKAISAQAYPNVAAALVDWVLSGDWDQGQTLADRLWAQMA